MRIVYAEEFERALRYWKKKDSRIFQSISSKIEHIIREPEIGKPLRNVLKSRRRIHVGPFVLLYEFRYDELRFLDFDHHDRIYKK